MFSLPFSVENTTQILLSASSPGARVGTIPSQIGLLKKLEYFNVSKLVTGTLPSQIGAISTLHIFTIEHNYGMRGSLPSEFGKLSSLITLHIRYCQLSGSLPTQIGFMTTLSTLTLYNNSLTGQFPSEIGHLTNLGYLNISANRFVGVIPSEIGRLTQLTFIFMDRNEFRSQIPSEIGHLKNLSYLFAGAARAVGTIPTQLGSAEMLTYLYLANNDLVGTIPSQINRLTRLQLLDMSYNQLVGTFIPVPSSKLTHLVLHSNHLTGPIPDTVSELSELRLLSLFRNRITGRVPPLQPTPNSHILLFDNHLSCELPSGPANNLTTVVALGNLFRLNSHGSPGANWLAPSDAKSVHLFVSFPRPYQLMIALFSTVTALSLLMACVSWHSTSTRVSLDRLWVSCARLCVLMAFFSAFNMGALGSAPVHIHTCTSWLTRFTYAESTQLSSLRCGSILTLAIVHFVFVVLGLVWLSRTRSAAGTQIAPLLPSTKSQLQRVAEAKWRRIARKVSLIVLYFAAIFILNMPTLVHFALLSFPSNNTLNIGAGFVWVVRVTLTPILVLISDVIIPRFSGYVVTNYYLNQKVKKGLHRKRFELILISQMLVLAIAPIVSEILVHDNCMALGRGFWVPCNRPSEANEFHVNIDIFVNTTALRRNHTIPVIDKADICKIRGLPKPELCVRGVIDATSRLNIFKVGTQALMMVFRTLLVVAGARWKGSWFSRMLNRCSLSKISEDGMTVAIVSWIASCFVYGGVAPLIWPAVMFAIFTSASVILFATRFASSEIKKRHRTNIPWRPVWCAVWMQLLLLAWYFVAANPCNFG
eukprot:c12704_g1_i1.p1 GENE.c12704_g1_i1~~c12704_g1_i1.p1  ORF type:complete len:850 (+),score=166.59 c12704_g1_i1:100-2550(+)